MLPFRFFGKLSFLCGSCWIKENLLRKQVENLFIKKKESKTLFFLSHYQMKVLFWRKSKLVFKRAKKVSVVGKSATLINLGDGLPVFN